MKKAIIADKLICQQLRKLLETKELLDLSYNLKKLSDGKIALPLNSEGSDHNTIDEVIFTSGIPTCKRDYEIGVHDSSSELTLPKSGFQIDVFDFVPKKPLPTTPYQDLVNSIHELLNEQDFPFTDEFRGEIPKNWEKHGDLVLLPPNSFKSDVWNSLGDDLWIRVCSSLSASRVARKDKITTDGFRTPQVTLLYGKDGWVEHVDNRIRYTYDVTKCMFSSGNVTEKLRIAGFDCRDEVVVDLYAGIGYFTLPYLVHAKAQHVHACEWNPNAVKALKKNVQLNGVEDRCTVYQGDNRQVCPKSIADRVNLGLIPSSEDGWPVACAALKPAGGIFHVHFNLESNDNVDYKQINQSNPDNDVDSCACSINRLETKSCDILSMKSCDHGNSESCDMTKNSSVPNGDAKYVSKKETKHKHWKRWAESTSVKIKDMLCKAHLGLEWNVYVLHIEHVKSYAPHIDHVVVDLKCVPDSCEKQQP